MNGEIEMVRTRLIRKPEDLETLQKETKMLDERQVVIDEIEILDTIELKSEVWKDFISSMVCKDWDFIKEQTDRCIWTSSEIKGLLVKEIGADDMQGIVVVPQGTAYARYAGLVMATE